MGSVLARIGMSIDHRPAVGAEITLVFLLILVQIWFIGQVLSFFVLLPLGVVVASWVLRKDSFQTLGLAHFSFKGFARLWLLLAAGVLIVLVVGAFANPGFHRNARFPVGVTLRFISYLVPALFQQILLNSYFVNRIHLLTNNRVSTILISGILFSVVHLPNPVLLFLTLYGGMISAYFFVKSRNVYPLAIAHTALAAVAYCALPQAWHHGFRVGMQFSLYTPVPGDPCIPQLLKLLGL
jgi:membrane protease YdiL (CAAX protease family)